ncbi:MAG: hypothetical protein ACKV2V_09030 [Blastocatellia bacterium]
MVHDNSHNIEGRLQQQASALLAGRLGSIESEVHKLQASISDFCERLLTQTVNRQASTEEFAEFNLHLRQAMSEEVDRGSSLAVAEALKQAEGEFERRLAETRADADAQINSLRTQLLAAQQDSQTAALALSNAGALAGGFDLLRQSLTTLDTQRTQSDALSTLVTQAAQFAPRLAFFVIKGGNAIGWKAAGFSNGLNDSSIRSLAVPLNSARLISDSVNQQTTAFATPETMSQNTSLLGTWGVPQASYAVVVPLTIRGKVAAVLYADSASQDSAAINTDALEILMHATGLIIELLPMRRSGEQARPAEPKPAAPEQPPVATTPVPTAPMPVIAPVGAPVTPPPAPAPVFYGGLGEEQSTRVEAGEHATPAAANLTQTQQAFTPPPAPAVELPPPVSYQPTPPPAASAPKPSTPLPGNASEAEVRAHNDARRFARLLVSEIKLYNEAKVAEGRRNNDLYERLKEDVDRSRQMYEKRVPSTVSSRFDYFYDELVHTLAEGDPSRLGHGCPGPTVPIA